jgi:hypothetical protein
MPRRTSAAGWLPQPHRHGGLSIRKLGGKLFECRGTLKDWERGAEWAALLNSEQSALRPVPSPNAT